MSVAAIIPAAGKGRRFGTGTPKLFVRVKGKPVLYYTLKNLCGAFPFSCVIVASDPDYFRQIEDIAYSLNLKNLVLVRGGLTRAHSVANALQAAAGIEWVLVHDAARPMVSRQLVRSVISTAQKFTGAIAAVPVTATVKRANRQQFIAATEDRNRLYLAQTPQVFRTRKLITRYQELGENAYILTDEASFFDGTLHRIRLVPGSQQNIKITTKEDLDIFRFYLK